MAGTLSIQSVSFNIVYQQNFTNFLKQQQQEHDSNGVAVVSIHLQPMRPDFEPRYLHHMWVSQEVSPVSYYGCSFPQKIKLPISMASSIQNPRNSRYLALITHDATMNVNYSMTPRPCREVTTSQICFAYSTYRLRSQLFCIPSQEHPKQTSIAVLIYRECVTSGNVMLPTFGNYRHIIAYEINAQGDFKNSHCQGGVQFSYVIIFLGRRGYSFGTPQFSENPCRPLGRNKRMVP